MGGRGGSSGKGSSGGGARTLSSEKEAEQFFAESDKKWLSKLTNKEESAIESYTEGGYQRINSSLRKGKTTEDSEVIDSAISKYEVKESFTTYRTGSNELLASIGVKTAQDVNSKNLKGKTVSDKAFLSTSTLKNIALDDLGDGIQIPKSQILLKIDVTPGKGKGAFIKKVSGAPEESEFLIKRGAKMKIKGARTENGRTVIDLQY